MPKRGEGHEALRKLTYMSYGHSHCSFGCSNGNLGIALYASGPKQSKLRRPSSSAHRLEPDTVHMFRTHAMVQDLHGQDTPCDYMPDR